MSCSRIIACFSAVIALTTSIQASFDEPKPGAISAKEAYARLKLLHGDWLAEIGIQGRPAGGQSARVSYRVTAAGNALVEELFKGTDHEMVTVYHLDGEDLVLTHYCAAGNQPRLKLDRTASNDEQLVFAFDGGTNLDPAKDAHMHQARFLFKKDEPVRSEWTAFVAGKADHTASFTLRKP